MRNNFSFGFFLDYRTEEGSIANYFLDYIVKRTETEMWIIELKGREDLEVSHKRQRLEQYCEDATTQTNGTCIYKSLYIKQDNWERYRPKDFKDLVNIHG